MSEWPTVSLGKVVKPIERPIRPEPGTRYRQIGVKLWGGGAYERESIDGSETRYPILWVAREGDIVVNQIWARNGSVAVVQSDLDGCVGSNEFPTYAVDTTQLLPRWVHWLTKTKGFWEQCDEKSRGTSGKNRIRPEKFLEVTIPLPTIAEQGRLILQIDALAAKIEEAKQLRDALSQETSALTKSAMRSVFTDLPVASTTLQEVCTAIIDCLHSNPIYADDGVPTVRSPDVGWGKLFLNTARKTDEAEYRRRTSRGEPAPGDIVVVREGGGTGKAGIVEKGQRFSLGQRVMMLRPDRDKIDPRFLLYHWLSPLIYEDHIMSRMMGSASPHLNIGAAKQFPIRLPPLSQQRQLVAYLDGLQEKSDELQRNQAEVAEELQAMLPAILDRAFRGELR